MTHDCVEHRDRRLNVSASGSSGASVERDELVLTVGPRRRGPDATLQRWGQ